MLLILLIAIPFLTGILNFTLKQGAKTLSLIGSIITTIISILLIVSLFQVKDAQHDILSSVFNEAHQINLPWIKSIGASFNLSVAPLSGLMVLLTGSVFSLIYLSQLQKNIDQSHRFFGLMQLAQAGLMGVFLANDLLLFYFFWELALIPVYFLCSTWGGEKRIRVTFKFFIYTFLGSLMLLGGIIFLYINNLERTFDINSLIATGKNLPEQTQQILFCFFFIAFAIKMPIFPFHTWQPDTYEQSATPITIVLSALMVKMGLFGIMKWLLPILPYGVSYWNTIIIALALIGLIYASLLAIVQTDIKRLLAYSSIAHIALMCIGIFAETKIAYDGLVIQMFNHGINITGLWLIVHILEEKFQTRNMNEMGGIAKTLPFLTIGLVIISFSNISLPLTSGFIGEFMLFHGIFQSTLPLHIVYMVIAGLGIILGAIYMLNMVQKVAYGNVPEQVKITKLDWNEKLAIGIVIILILVLGVYPTALFGLLG